MKKTRVAYRKTH